MKVNYFFFANLLLFFALSCESTTSPEPEPELESKFSIIVEDSFYNLSVVHKSHFGEENDQFGIFLDLELSLNAPEDRDQIKKLIIYDNSSMGWEFKRNELEEFYSDSLKGYKFSNLLIDNGNYEADKLFQIRVLGDLNENAGDYNFILKGGVPYPVTSSNYWGDLQNLETLFFVDDNYSFNGTYSNNTIRGYNPITDSESYLLYYLDENENFVEKIDQDKSNYNQNDYFYTNSLSSVPENARYYYNTFSIKDSSSGYSLITPITELAPRHSESTQFYELKYEDNKILGATENYLIGIQRNDHSPNYDTLFVINKNTMEITEEIQVRVGNFDTPPPAYLDVDSEVIYYIKGQSLLSFDLNTDQIKGLNAIFSGISYWKVYPYGSDFLAVQNDYYLSLYSISGDSLLNPDSQITHNVTPQISASYYFEKEGALYMARENDYFYRAVYDFEENRFLTVDETYYSAYYNFDRNRSNPRFHFSTVDSLLIHSTGLVINPNKNEHIQQKIINSVEFESNGSTWIDEIQWLIINNRFETVDAYEWTGSSFLYKGSLNTTGFPLDLIYDEGKIQVMSKYPRSYYGENNGILLLESFSISDFSEPKRLKYYPKYLEMIKVRL